MTDLLTPRQVARALDVSESSVKRWCDKGVIETQHTAGGHRRIELRQLISLVRAGKLTLVNPDLLGLPASTGKTTRSFQQIHKQLATSLLAGEEAVCRQIALDLYLAEHSLSVICDDVFSAAFKTIGSCWEEGTAEIYQERRATEIAGRIIYELRSLLPATGDDAPIAIGGAPSGDQYTLGTAVTELVLRDGGWNSVSLGGNLPFETFSAAIKHHQPRMFWLSCSYLPSEPDFLAGYRALHEEFSHEVAFVVGGIALTEDLRQQMKFAAYCDNMQHLEGFAQSLCQAISKRS